MKYACNASLAFKTERPSAKPSFGTNIINALTPVVSTAKKAAQSNFSDLPIPVDELQTINDNLAAAVAAAHSGDRVAVNNVKAAVAEWNNAFSLTAKYVSQVADGDAAVILSAGFTPTKSESTPAQKPAVPANFKATINGSKGAIIAGTKKAVPSAKFYVYSAVPDDVTVNYADNVMILTVGGKSMYITVDTRKATEFYNLPSCVPFSVSMFAVNSAGAGPASSVQQVTTQ